MESKTIIKKKRKPEAKGDEKPAPESDRTWRASADRILGVDPGREMSALRDHLAKNRAAADRDIEAARKRSDERRQLRDAMPDGPPPNNRVRPLIPDHADWSRLSDRQLGQLQQRGHQALLEGVLELTGIKDAVSMTEREIEKRAAKREHRPVRKQCEGCGGFHEEPSRGKPTIH